MSYFYKDFPNKTIPSLGTLYIVLVNKMNIMSKRTDNKGVTTKLYTKGDKKSKFKNGAIVLSRITACKI